MEVEGGSGEEHFCEKAYLHINNIINSVEQIVFSEQWQVDEYELHLEEL